MDMLNGVTPLKQAILVFWGAHGVNVPAAAQALFIPAAASSVPAVALFNTCEILYACQGAITDAPSKAAAQTLCGQLANFGALNAINGLGENGRGVGIVNAMRRELGETVPEGTAWPDPSADPAPDPRFIAQAHAILTPPS